MVFSAGQVLTAAGLNDATLAAIQTYTPTVAGGGSVTWTTRTGWYYKIGTSHIVFFNIYLVANAQGTGSSNVTVTAPTNIDRTTRQVVECTARDWQGGAGVTSFGVVRSLTTGSGAVWDEIDLVNPQATFSHTGQIGSDISAGGILSVQGFYREA